MMNEKYYHPLTGIQWEVEFDPPSHEDNAKKFGGSWKNAKIFGKARKCKIQLPDGPYILIEGKDLMVTWNPPKGDLKL